MGGIRAGGDCEVKLRFVEIFPDVSPGLTGAATSPTSRSSVRSKSESGIAAIPGGSVPETRWKARVLSFAVGSSTTGTDASGAAWTTAARS